MPDVNHRDMDHLWSFPGLSNVTVDRKKLRSFLESEYQLVLDNELFHLYERVRDLPPSRSRTEP